MEKKVIDILNEEEKLEIKRLRIRILESKSIFKTRDYKKQIEQIIENAIKRHNREKITS